MHLHSQTYIIKAIPEVHLHLEILPNDKIKSAVTGIVFNEVDLCICRLDELARNNDIQEKLKVTEWDLIVCDEAIKSSEIIIVKRCNSGLL